MQGIKRGSLLWIAVAFLLCGVLHVLFHRVQYAWNFSEIFCGCVCVFWALSVRKRVTDRRLQRLLLHIAGLLLAYEFLQVCRYSLYPSSPRLDKILLYAYYIPKTALPLLCLSLALGLHRPESKPLPAWFRLMLAAACLMVIGVMTNNLHRCFVSFSGNRSDDGSERNGWLYYLINAFNFVNYFAAFFLLLRKSRVFRGQRFRWLPLIPLGAGLLYFAVYALNLGKRFFGVRVWNTGEILVFLMVGALECCIQTGMIPANTDYEHLFTMAKLPAAILDENDVPRYTTAAADYPFRAAEGLQILRHPIHGGSVEWVADVSRLRAVNRALAEAAQKIEIRNGYLAAEAKIRAEKAEMETRNRIYDSVLQAVRPQLERISALLDSPDGSFEDRLKRIAVLSAYVKRRSNMELLAEADSLPARELHLALNESAVYLRGMGAAAAVTMESGCLLPAGLVIAAYEQTERVIEDSMDSIAGLMVHVLAEPGRLTLRMLLQNGGLTLQTNRPASAEPGFLQSVSFAQEGRDLLLIFRYADPAAAAPLPETPQTGEEHSAPKTAPAAPRDDPRDQTAPAPRDADRTEKGGVDP